MRRLWIVIFCLLLIDAPANAQNLFERLGQGMSRFGQSLEQGFRKPNRHPAPTRTIAQTACIVYNTEGYKIDHEQCSQVTTCWSRQRCDFVFQWPSGSRTTLRLQLGREPQLNGNGAYFTDFASGNCVYNTGTGNQFCWADSNAIVPASLSEDPPPKVIEAEPFASSEPSGDRDPIFFAHRSHVSTAGNTKAVIEIGEITNLAQIRGRFQEFEVEYDPECEGGGCIRVIADRAFIQIGQDDTGKISALYLWGERTADGYANEVGDSLIKAFGTDQLQCESGLFTICNGHKPYLPKYVTGAEMHGGCFFQPIDGGVTKVPDCARIAGYAIYNDSEETGPLTKDNPNRNSSISSSPEAIALERKIKNLEEQLKGLEASIE